MNANRVHHGLCSAAVAAYISALAVGVSWAGCAEACTRLAEGGRSSMEWLADVEERLDKGRKQRVTVCVTQDGHQLVLHWEADE